MDIHLVNQFDSVEEAWKFSRPAVKEVNMMGIRGLNLPVNEFQVMHLQVECTIAERELFTMSRRHVMWAQTSRVQNILEFEYDSKLFHHHEVLFMKEMKCRMEKEEKEGIRQDEYRRHLPIFSLTKFNLLITVRDLFRVMHDFKYMNAISSSGCVSESFGRGFLAIRGFISRFTEYEDVNGVKHDKIKSKIHSMEFDPKLFANKEFGIVSFQCSFNLRAQMVRHRDIVFVDDFLYKLTQPTAYQMTQDSPIKMEIAGAIPDLKAITSKRACWIAHYDIWKEPIRKINMVIGADASDLPCHEAPCPFDADARIRYTDDDPNPPCPIHAGRNKIMLSKAQTDEIHDMIATDQRPDFWYGEIF